jgi:hypothetical protein
VSANRKAAAGRHPEAASKKIDSSQYSRIDPLTGWFNLVKQSRIERKPKRGWNLGRARR